MLAPNDLCTHVGFFYVHPGTVHKVKRICSKPKKEPIVFWFEQLEDLSGVSTPSVFKVVTQINMQMLLFLVSSCLSDLPGSHLVRHQAGKADEVQDCVLPAGAAHALP